MDYSFFETVGYHTFEDRSHPNDVRNAPFKSNDANAYLGRGYYYWERNLQLGKLWGGLHYYEKGKQYHVGESKLRCHRSIFFDLVGDMEQQEMLLTLSRLLAKKRPARHNWPIGKMIEFLKASSFDPDSEFFDKFNFKLIRAADDNFSKLKPEKTKFAEDQKSFMELNPCYIICVLNTQDIVLGSILVVHSSNAKT